MGTGTLVAAIILAAPLGLIVLVSWPVKRKYDRVLLDLCRKLEFPPQPLTWFEALRNEVWKRIEGTFHGFSVRLVVFPPRKRELRMAFARPLPGGLRILPRTPKSAPLDRLAIEGSGLGEESSVLADDPGAARAFLDDERFRVAVSRFRSACPTGRLLSGEIVVPAADADLEALPPILETMAALAEALPAAEPSPPEPEPNVALAEPSSAPLVVSTRNPSEAGAVSVAQSVLHSVGNPLAGYAPIHALGPVDDRERELRAAFAREGVRQSGVATAIMLAWVGILVVMARADTFHSSPSLALAVFCGLPCVSGILWYVTPSCPVCGNRPGRGYPTFQIPCDCPTCGLRLR